MYYILLFDCKLNSLKSLCSFDYSISMLRKHWLFIWSSWVENLKARRLRTVNSIAHIKQVCLDSIFKQNNNNNGFLSRMFESSLLSIISCFLLANLSQTSANSTFWTSEAGRQRQPSPDSLGGTPAAQPALLPKLGSQLSSWAEILLQAGPPSPSPLSPTRDGPGTVFLFT